MKVLKCILSARDENLLARYLQEFLPDAEVETLESSGIRGKIKKASRPDIVLVIVDETQYDKCIDVAGDVLSMPKVHKYTGDYSFQNFLISKFGELPSLEEESDFNGTFKDDPFVNDDDMVDTALPQEFGFSGETSVEPSDMDSLGNFEEEDIPMPMPVMYRGSEDSEGDSDKDTKIEELKIKLSQVELLNKNLQRQLEEGDSAGDISELVNRIKELESELEQVKANSGDEIPSDYYEILGKVTQAERVISELEQVKEKLRTLERDKANLEHDKLELNNTLELMDKELDKLKTEVASIEVLKENISQLEGDLDKKDEVITERDGQIEGYISEIGVLQSKLEELNSLTEKVEQLQSSLSDSELKVNNLQVDISAKLGEIEELNSKIKKSNEELDARDSDIRDLNNQISTLTDANENLVSEKEEIDKKAKGYFEQISSLNHKVDELTNKISEVTDELVKTKESYEENIASLNDDLDKLSSKDTEIDSLKNAISDYKSTIATLNSRISELSDIISSKEKEVIEINQKLVVAEENVTVKDEAFNEALEKQNELQDKLLELETEKASLSATVTELNNQLKESERSYSAEIDGKNETIRQLNDKTAKMDNEIASLKATVQSAVADASVLKDLQDRLLNEQRKSANLASKLEVKERNDDSNRASELRTEIARLKNELDKVKSSSSNSEEFDTLQNELTRLRSRYTDLELDLSDCNEQIKEMKENVFTRLGESSGAFISNRYAMNPINIKADNFVCLASGAGDSIRATYFNVAKYCQTNKDKKVLLIDLAVDTYAELVFGIKKVKDATKWVVGSAPLKEVVSNTEIPNLVVAGVGYERYFNELSLMHINWQKRLEELQSLGSNIKVILYVGCISSTISKVLLSSFSSVFKSIVVANGAPCVMRAAHFHLRSLGDINQHNTSLKFVDYKPNAGAIAYYKWIVESSKDLSVGILQENEVLDF